MSTILSTPISLKHEGSPFQRSLSSVSTSSPSSAKNNFSPNHTLLSQPTSSAAVNSNINGAGYQVYGVSPPEAATASASGMSSGGNGPASTVESGDLNLKKENIEFVPHDLGTTASEFSMPSVDHHLSAPNSQLIQIKDPFDDSYDNVPSVQTTYNHQPMGPQSQQIMEQMHIQRMNMYPYSDKSAMQRFPYAFNRPFCPPYPIPAEFQGNPAAYLNRSSPYHPAFPFPIALMRPQMAAGPMTPGNYAPTPQPVIPQQQPAPPPAKKTKSKSKQNQQQQQQQQQQMPPMSMQQQMMMRMPLPPNIQQQMMMQQQMAAMNAAAASNNKMVGIQRLQQAQRSTAAKFVHDGRCASCGQAITKQNYGIRCTALNQGCLQSFHPQCVGIDPTAFQLLVQDTDIEWVCHVCSKDKPLRWSV